MTTVCPACGNKTPVGPPGCVCGEPMTNPGAETVVTSSSHSEPAPDQTLIMGAGGEEAPADQTVVLGPPGASPDQTIALGAGDLDPGATMVVPTQSTPGRGL